MTRANAGEYTSPMASIDVVTPGPAIPEMAMMRITPGWPA